MLTAFHSGGMGERAAILDALSRPAPDKGAYDILVALRISQRLKKRAEELNATIPDPSVLVVALDKLYKPAIAADYRLFAMNRRLILFPLMTKWIPSLECY